MQRLKPEEWRLLCLRSFWMPSSTMTHALFERPHTSGLVLYQDWLMLTRLYLFEIKGNHWTMIWGVCQCNPGVLLQRISYGLSGLWKLLQMDVSMRKHTKKTKYLYCLRLKYGKQWAFHKSNCSPSVDSSHTLMTISILSLACTQHTHTMTMSAIAAAQIFLP